MTRWEYRWESIDPRRVEIDTLNRLGAEGWEVTAMAPVPRSDSQLLLLKRETAQ